MGKKPAQKKAQTSHPDELSFMPPYSAQREYLILADKYLALDRRDKVQSIDSSRHFRRPSKKAA